MRILFVSHVFSPSIGGIEQVSALLAAEFMRQGHEVRLVTQTAAAGDQTHDWVYRRPSALTLLRLHRWCDVCFHNNITLPRAWPLLLISRPWIVAHHVWIPRTGMAARLKRLFLRRATGISISRAIADDLQTRSSVIPNPYRDTTFRILPGVERDRDLIFVGRLVSDKGAHTLLAAVAELRKRGLQPSVTIVGEGPEAPVLRAQAEALGLASTIRFTGLRDPEGVAQLLNEHRIIAVPSLWAEPSGLVALEGIACGCVAVGSDRGGLREAIGECGETFPNGNVDALADTLECLLRDSARLAARRTNARRHLERHLAHVVAAEYLRVFEVALARRSGRPERVQSVPRA